MFKLLASPVWHFGHFMSLLVMLLIPCIVMLPPVILVVVLLLMAPQQKAIGCIKGVFDGCVAVFPSAQRWTESSMKSVKAVFTQNSERKMLWASMDVLSHTWIWLILTGMMLTTWHDAWFATADDAAPAADGAASAAVARWTWTTFMKGTTYLLLSELFLHGFLFHPYFGYFLGVHRTFGRGFAPPSSASSTRRPGAGGSKGGDDELNEMFLPSEEGSASMYEDGGDECQPTMSTYSFLTSISCFNLNYHVEHHDFPKVPWSRLPQVKALAPTFYDRLEQSPGFVHTIWMWFKYGHEWSYACHADGAIDAEFGGRRDRVGTAAAEP